MTDNGNKQFDVSAASDGGLVVRRGRKKRCLSFEEAFSFGHSLIEAGHTEQALKLFTALAKVRNRGARARIMVAQCRAQLEDFDACREILENVFSDEDHPIVEELQAAFVCHRLGMSRAAMNELQKIVTAHADLPTACLFLGDLFMEASNLKNAAYFWKLAVKRDKRGGAVAKTAKKQLARLVKRQSAGKGAAKKKTKGRGGASG